MGADSTDAMILRLQREIEDRSGFIGNLVAAAQNESRDLDDKEMELIGAAKDRISVVKNQLAPLNESVTLTMESRAQTAQYAAQVASVRTPEAAMEYRSFGAYVTDVYQASQRGGDDASRRLELYHRAAAHQTTADNPGLLPQPILGPVLNFVDAARPLVSGIGPVQLPTGSFSRPQVTQHTLVGLQTAEKTELPSRKMLIGKIPVNASTYGGYVNVGMQNRDWTTPQIIDIITQDLAQQYAIETEKAAGVYFTGGAVLGTAPPLPAAPTAAEVGGALWSAVAQIVGLVPGASSFAAYVSPDMAAVIAPLFVNVNPTNAISTGFTASNYGSGPIGVIAGIPIIMSPGLAAKTILVVANGSAEVYEDRLGVLSVTEPSVLGVQVGYAGYFAPVLVESQGVVKVGVV